MQEMMIRQSEDIKKLTLKDQELEHTIKVQDMKIMQQEEKFQTLKDTFNNQATTVQHTLITQEEKIAHLCEKTQQNIPHVNSWANVAKNGEANQHTIPHASNMYMNVDEKEYHEREKRNMNIVVCGIPESDNEKVLTLNRDVTDVIANRFGMQDVVVYGAHCVGKKRPKSSRAIACTMLDARKRPIILENAWIYLKDSAIYICEDKTPMQQKEWRQAYEERMKWNIVPNIGGTSQEKCQGETHGITDIHATSWNCDGFPWHKGDGLTAVLPQGDILFLLETWEHDARQIPHIDGYVTTSIWMSSMKMRGQGGVAVMYKEEFQKVITICKVDEYKRYIWVKIESKDICPGCYIPHRELPFYNAFKIEKTDPFGDLYANIATYTQEGVVMIMGDMNARIAHNQMQAIDFTLHLADKERYHYPNPMWERCLSDITTNSQGSALISMMTSMQMIVINGSQKFADSGKYTCYTANNGLSTIDYMLIKHDTSHIVHDFGGRTLSKLRSYAYSCMATSAHTKGEKGCRRVNLVLQNTNREEKDYAAFLDGSLAKQIIPCNVDDTWHIFKQAVVAALEATMGRTHQKKNNTEGMPNNPWLFDEECKIAKRKLRTTLKSTEEWTLIAKNYNALIRRKRRGYELDKEQKEIMHSKKNPKRVWQKMKGRQHDIMGDFSQEDMYAYVENLYAHKNAKEMVEKQPKMHLESL
ncbi:hypothetical protein L7F22_040826 [Adiantum nelumboides]|nr:hypothetical protein [Adiantum nelumboides]